MWYVTKTVLFGKCLQRTVPTSMPTLLLFFSSVSSGWFWPSLSRLLHHRHAILNHAIAPVSVSERRIIVICNCKENKQTVTVNMFVLFSINADLTLFIHPILELMPSDVCETWNQASGFTAKMRTRTKRTYMPYYSLLSWFYLPGCTWWDNVIFRQTITCLIVMRNICI